MAVHIVILAAGQGKRMNSDLPKVAHTIGGRNLVGWVIESAKPLNPSSIVVVLGHGSEHVKPTLDMNVTVAIQEEQLGTGHAAQIGIDALGHVGESDVIVVLYGDTPMLTAPLIAELADLGESESGRLITARLDDPSGYGRVIRNESDSVIAVVEHRDCSQEQLARPRRETRPSAMVAR